MTNTHNVAKMRESDLHRGDLLGHPRGLITLSGTELWERFAYYAIQVILAYYIYFSVTDGGIGLAKPVALSLVGAYGGATYIAQMGGSWVADRILGSRTTALIGAIIVTVGYFVLSLVPGVFGLVCGLALIVIGTGGLKVNLSAMVGDLYTKEDLRRDSGFSLYYFGISLGATLGPIFSGYLQDRVGFRIAFLVGAIGMLLGAIQYAAGMKHMPKATWTAPNPLSPKSRMRAGITALAVVVVTGLLIAFGLMRLDNLNGYIQAVIVVGVVTYFALLLTSEKTTLEERHGVIAYIPVFLALLTFWALLLQLFTTLAVFSAERVNLDFFGWQMPPAYVIAAEGVFATIWAPIWSWIWLKMGSRQPRRMTKMLGALVGMGIGYGILALSTGDLESKVPLLVVLFAFVLFGCAEVIAAPIGMASTSTLAPKRFSTQMMSLYYLTMAGGASLAGTLSGMYTAENERTYFTATALGTFAVVVVLGIVAAVLRRSYPSIRTAI